MKKNNKGFVLVETLVVTVFVMAVFSVIYINFYPLVGEYERREFYDDVDSKYGAFWMKRFIQDSSYSLTTFKGNVAGSKHYHVFSCSQLSAKQGLCENLRTKLHIKNVYITDYNLTQFKTVAAVEGGFSDSLKSYIDYLPEYKVASLNNANYRVIIEFERKTYDNTDTPEIYNTYASMEVVKR